MRRRLMGPNENWELGCMGVVGDSRLLIFFSAVARLLFFVVHAYLCARGALSRRPTEMWKNRRTNYTKEENASLCIVHGAHPLIAA